MEEFTPTELVLLKAKAKLEALLESVESLGEGKGVHDATVKQACRLSQAISANAAQIRQYEKAKIRALASFTRDQIVEHIRSMPETERRSICNDILGTEDNNALL